MSLLLKNSLQSLRITSSKSIPSSSSSSLLSSSHRSISSFSSNSSSSSILSSTIYNKHIIQRNNQYYPSSVSLCHPYQSYHTSLFSYSDQSHSSPASSSSSSASSPSSSSSSHHHHHHAPDNNDHSHGHDAHGHGHGSDGHSAAWHARNDFHGTDFLSRENVERRVMMVLRNIEKIDQEKLKNPNRSVLIRLNDIHCIYTIAMHFVNPFLS